MILKKSDKNIVCECGGCKNKATYMLKNESAFLNNSFYICDKCMKEIYELFGKEFTPKSIKNIYRRTDVNEKNKK